MNSRFFNVESSNCTQYKEICSRLPSTSLSTHLISTKHKILVFGLNFTKRWKSNRNNKDLLEVSELLTL